MVRSNKDNSIHQHSAMKKEAEDRRPETEAWSLLLDAKRTGITRVEDSNELAAIRVDALLSMGESFWKDGALAGVDSILIPCRVAELWGDKYLECAAGEVERLCAARVDVLRVLGAVVECDAGHGHVDVGEAEGGEGRLVAKLKESA